MLVKARELLRRGRATAGTAIVYVFLWFIGIPTGLLLLLFLLGVGR